MDIYTKFILTIIAIALSLIALNPWVFPERAIADGVSYVNLVGLPDNGLYSFVVGGQNDRALKVVCINCRSSQ